MEDIEAVVSLELDGSAVNAAIHINNRSTRTVEEVIFPMLGGLGPLPEAAIVWPDFSSRRIDDPFGRDLGGDHLTWNELTQKCVSRYPPYLASAWCDYGNSASGIALEGRHTDFSIMDFFIHKVVKKDISPVRRTLDIATVHPRRISPGETAGLSAVRIFVHNNDWHTVADTHRDWLETWIRKPDRPGKFSESIGWHSFFMKHQD